MVGAKYLINQTYCFTCGKYFTWDNFTCPTNCLRCGHLFEKGDFCRPDFILEWPKKKRVGVVMVNGGIHDRNRVRKRDKAIIRDLLDRKVRVFVVLNEEIDKVVKEKSVELVADIWSCMKSDSMYAKYIKGGDYQERCFL